jgi:hypothetical protein
MPVTGQNSHNYFRTLSIVYFAFLFGQVIIVAASYLVGYEGDPLLSEQRNILMIISIVLMFGSYRIGTMLYLKKLNKAKGEADLIRKMNLFREATIIRMALPEGATMITAIFYFLTSDLIFIGFAATMIVTFILLYPSKQGAVSGLALSDEEKARVMNPEEIIAETNNG